MRPSRGFSLIEVTISIFIIGVVLLLLQAIIRSSTLIRMTKSQGIALSIARNKLESVRVGGYTNIPVSGSFSDSLVSTFPRAATTTLTVSTYNTKTKQIIVSVIWRDPGAAASSTVSLLTLMTETGGLP